MRVRALGMMLLLAGAAACSRLPRASTADAGQQHDDQASTVIPPICPPGTHRYGNPPPEGSFVGCIVNNPSAALIASRAERYDPTSVFHGPVVHYYPDGTVKERHLYDMGDLVNAYFYWSNGNTQRIEDYERHEMVRRRTWFEDGNPEYDWRYRGGRIDGLMTSWRRDGTVQTSCRVNGRTLWVKLEPPSSAGPCPESKKDGGP